MTASASGQALQRPKHERKSLPLDHPRSAGNYPTGGSILNDNPGSVPSDNQHLLTSTHEIYGGGTIRENDKAKNARDSYQPYRGVSIGPDCRLGANSAVLPGVTLGGGCFVSENAVVTKSFSDYSILVGVPAVVKGSRLKISVRAALNNRTNPAYEVPMTSAPLHKLMQKARSAARKVGNLRGPKNGDAIVVKPSKVNGLRLHLGAGPINLQGWVNIDARLASHIHLIANNFELIEFSDGSLAEIYMCHVLEHFSFAESEQLLKNFCKKLKPGGVLRISVPHFDQLVTIYQANGNDLEVVKQALMGGQDYEYNFHKSIYNPALLSALLVKCGYEQPQAWSTDEEFGADIGDWSNKSFDTPGGIFPVSLNIKAFAVGA